MLRLLEDLGLVCSRRRARRPYASASRICDIYGYPMGAQEPGRDEKGVFVRLPVTYARLLDRAAAAVPARKKDLIAGLVARHVDPDTPEGLESLRGLASQAPRGTRRILIEEERGLQRGSAGFNPFPPTEVLDADGAAELLAVESATVIELAEQGEIPG